MTSLSYSVPVAGQTLNSIADPMVSTALTSIINWSTQIDSGNLSSTAGILRSQLSGGGGNLTVTTVTTNSNATD